MHHSAIFINFFKEEQKLSQYLFMSSNDANTIALKSGQLQDEFHGTAVESEWT